MEKLSCCLLIFYYLYVVLLYINRAVKRCLKKINSEITLKYFCLKADFQSSHEAPRSSLRVMHEHFHPITMLNSSF